jgi:acyl-CoA synthetase (AMP-forming)/AMP-acid ligase II
VGYGLTETSPLVAGCSEKHTRLYSVGKPVPGVEVRIDYEQTGEEHGGVPASTRKPVAATEKWARSWCADRIS